MAESLSTQIDKLRRSIQGLEAQRQVLGDEIINPAMDILRQQLASLEQQFSEQAAPVEERRMVTILFTDMVGSTPMAEKMDPEEWRQVVAQVHATLGETIAAYHGTVAQYLGDGILAFFGSKETSEHDPENAIRAALDSHTAVANLSLPENIQLRAGIHTGLVVVGELGDAIHKEFTASGDAMNLAARLQSAAPPGGTLISHDTYRYVRGVFDLTPRPPLSVKGKSEPVQTYLVRRAKPRPFRSVTRGVAGVEAPTVGRDEEIQALRSAYMHAYEGHGIVWAQLLGEPGVGKSRLVADMTDWLDLRDENFRLLRARAFPDDANQPFALVRRLWFDRFQVAEDIPLALAETRWVDHFRDFSGQEDIEEAAHALGLLVGLSFENSPHIKGMRDDPTQVKGRALVVSRELIDSVRQRNPIVVLLEDLQWADPASWEYLMEVFLGEARAGNHNGLFILGAARLEWTPPDELVELFKSSYSLQKTNHKWGTQILLPPLSDQSIQQLSRELLQRAVDVPEQVIDLLVTRSEGVPYFTEEMVNWFIDHGMLETGTEPWHFYPERLKAQPLPATLQHLLLTRLGALSQSERATLQRGSIFGRRFWTGGVEALGIFYGEETLAHLQPRGFVVAQPESAFQGDTEWTFHQNLLQEVTYESVLKRERAALHKVAAGWLEKQARQAGRLEEFAGLLGDHYERAGELSAAADWYLLAGKRAMAQGAPREANNFYTQALNLLPPVDHERLWQAQLGREDALAILSDAEPWKKSLAALIELAHTIDDDNYLAEAYIRQAKFGLSTGDVPIIIQASREALDAARRCSSEALEAKALILNAVANIQNEGKSIALGQVEEALKLARRLGDDDVLAFILFRGAFCYGELGEVGKSQALLIEHVEVAHRMGDRNMEAMSLGNLGSGYVGRGQFKLARPVLEQALQITNSLGAHRLAAYNLMNLASLYFYTGDNRKAILFNEQALQEIYPSQDARGKSFVLDNLAEVLLAMDDAPGAARHFSEAFEVASSKGLVAMACQATAGLAACAVRQGQLDEARKYVQEAWNYLEEHGWIGMSAPGWVYRACAEVFEVLGEDETAQAAIQDGYRNMIKVADSINIPEWRQSFLENIPDHRWIVDMWERSRG